MDKRYLSKIVVEWYAENKRNLPWRRSKDPYKIWISEVILQQTRVDQGLDYYKNFVKTFPNVRALARAHEDKVLRLWQGLGYYTRARNLHKCAKAIVRNYGGKFPSEPEELLNLPGIGEYTSAAIASIVFNKQSAVVDGNVYRVLSRLFGIELPVNSTAGKQRFRQLADELIPGKDPGTYNQALMEFGALHCTPKNPDCDCCPFRKICVARAQGTQHLLPVKEKKSKATKRYFYYFVIEKKGALLMTQRTEKDIWKGLYEFKLVETKRSTDPKRLLNTDPFLKSLRINKKIKYITQPYKHVLSHRVIYCQFVHVTLAGTESLNGLKMKFYEPKKLDKLPKPVLVSRYLHDVGIL